MAVFSKSLSKSAVDYMFFKKLNISDSLCIDFILLYNFSADCCTCLWQAFSQDMLTNIETANARHTYSRQTRRVKPYTLLYGASEQRRVRGQGGVVIQPLLVHHHPRAMRKYRQLISEWPQGKSTNIGKGIGFRNLTVDSRSLNKDQRLLDRIYIDRNR